MGLNSTRGDMSRSPAHSSGGALSPSFLSPVASSRARARSSSTKSPASGHGEEEDEEAWGITEGEDSDFKRR